MYFYFESFRYDIDKQILYKESELVPLKKNQAVLLSFLLSEPDSIHSKEDILNTVWSNQIVSEQVVFQTISQLRAILGHDAIRTFAKKGYKWNLSISQEALTNELGNTSKSSKVIPKESSTSVSLTFKPIPTLVISFIFLAAAFLIFRFESHTKKVELYMLMDDADKSHDSALQTVIKAFSRVPQFELSHSSTDISIAQAFTSPKRAFSKSDTPTDGWLIWGDIYESDQRAIFHYGLSGRIEHWQGYIEANSVKFLPSKLSERFEQLVEIGLFTGSEQKIAISELRSQLEIRPQDPDLLLLIAKYHETTDQYDVALSYLQRLIKADSINQWSPYRAIALWKIGKIYKMRGQYIQAHHSLEEMSEVLAQSPIGPLHFQYVKTKAWLAYSETDHQTMYQTLEEGLRYFDNEGKKQPLLKFKLHVLSSILALKVSDHEMKYYHLSQAQALLIKHQLDESNLATVYYHLALFSQYINNTVLPPKQAKSSHNEHLVYLEKVLQLPRTIDNFWIHDEAIELLINHHIEKENFTAAYSMLNSKTLTPKRLFLKAKLLLAQQKTKEALELFEQAFERANINYDKRTAIESALKLYYLNSEDLKEQSVYLAFLESNARADWLRDKLVLVQSPNN